VVISKEKILGYIKIYFIAEFFLTLLEYTLFASLTKLSFDGLSLVEILFDFLRGIIVPNQLTVLILAVFIIYDLK